MATSPAPQRNWLTRLKNLPRRWWITFFAISLVVHVIGVGTVLVLLFGGARGGDNAAESLIISAAADDQQIDRVTVVIDRHWRILAADPIGRDQKAKSGTAVQISGRVILSGTLC